MRTTACNSRDGTSKALNVLQSDGTKGAKGKATPVRWGTSQAPSPIIIDCPMKRPLLIRTDRIPDQTQKMHQNSNVQIPIAANTAKFFLSHTTAIQATSPREPLSQSSSIGSSVKDCIKARRSYSSVVLHFSMVSFLRPNLVTACFHWSCDFTFLINSQ